MVEQKKEEEINQLRYELKTVKQMLNTTYVELQQQLELAAKVQRSMLPEPIRHKLIHVDTRYIPIEKIGGDYCQVHLPGSDACYITMSDVTGHGIGPALLASRVCSEVRHYILHGLAPCDIVSKLNQFIFNNFSKTALYLSFIAAQINLESREITWCGAGHPSPLLIRYDGSGVEMLHSQTPWIGVRKHILAKKSEHTAKLYSGDRLIFYTDGLIEIADAKHRKLNITGLTDIAVEAMKEDLFEMADRILDKATNNCKISPNDDVSLIVAEIK